MIKFNPVKDFVVVTRAEDKSSRLVMPDKVEPVSDDIFEVMEVGPGSDDYPQFLQIGDLICITGYINTFSYKGEKVILARARDVMAIIKEL